MDSLYKKRIWELDFLRGLAVIFMIYFHIIFDLNEFMGLKVSYLTGFNYLTGRIAAYLFIIISGISCSFSKNNIKRGLKVLACALAITLVSYIYNPQYAILFGVLHFFGVSFILYPLINKIPKFALPFVALMIIAANSLISSVYLKHNFFAPFGLHSRSFSSADYYPLIPYLGYFILGDFLGKIIYKNKKSIIPITCNDNLINLIGRHSLLFYLIHQPIIILIISLIKSVTNIMA